MARLIELICRLGIGVAAACILFIAFGIFANIVARAYFNYSLVWMLEAVEYALVAMTFAGTAYVLLIDRHTKIDVLISTLGSKAASRLTVFADFIGLMTVGTLTWYSALALYRSFESGDYIYNRIELPEWVTLTGLPFGFGMLTLVFALRIWQHQPAN